MKLTFQRYELKLKYPFKISRGSRTVEPVIVVQLTHGGITGYGEASPSQRYGETIETVEAFLSRVDLARFDDPLQLQRILEYVDSVADGNSSAKAAIDIALHDWLGKKLGLPLYKYWGLGNDSTPLTSLTIGIDTPEVLEKKVLEAEEYPVLKIKLGGSNDEQIMKVIRKLTQKTLRVDANEGWKSKELALEKIRWLENEGVEFVEQPLPSGDLSAVAWLRERVNLPLIADESCLRLRDVPKLKDVYDGINIKLMKCTGLREAVKMVHAARACGLKIMVGCMIETSIGISAAAQISPLIDYADLDGSVLTSNDPFEGVQIVKGKLILPERPGIGVKSKD